MNKLSSDDLKKITMLIDSKTKSFVSLSDDEYRCTVSGAVSAVLGPRGFSIKEKCAAVERVFAKLKGFDILQPLMDDTLITDIMVNGPEDIFYERLGVLYRHEDRFDDYDHLMDLIHRIFDSCGKTISEKDPIADITLKDGSRANTVLQPVAVNGPVLSIRKFTGIKPDMESLIRSGFISESQSEMLSESVISGHNIFISGGTGSGKTTFLNALSAYIPENERIIIIEDSPELCFRNSPNIVQLQTRSPFADKTGEICISDLIRCALRMRPDRLIVGEVRGKEAADMLWAMNTGHKGSLSTGHSNSASDMLSRLSFMAREADDIPSEIINNQIASSIDIVVHLERNVSGERHVSEIIRVKGYDEGEFVYESI